MSLLTGPRVSFKPSDIAEFLGVPADQIKCLIMDPNEDAYYYEMFLVDDDGKRTSATVRVNMARNLNE